MRILAIETSTKQGSVALLEPPEVLSERLLTTQQRTAQSLSPTLAALLAQCHWPPRSIGLVAVANGPGSFTGLRIATTAAKTYAYAVGAAVIAVNTLDVIAEQLPDGVQDACAVMDAQRRQLFAARYQRCGGRWEPVTPCQIVPRDGLERLLGPGTVLTGTGLQRLEAGLYAGHVRADQACWLPRAGTVARLGLAAYEAGRRDDPFQLQPQYYRPSYAEEKRTD